MQLHTTKSQTGLVAHLSGQAAEDSVAANYLSRNHEILARRWRGASGEIDMITNDDGVLVFTEVKKSRTFSRAAASLSHSQQARIIQAATEYLGQSNHPLETDMRFDVALLDQHGQIQVLENALMQ